MEIQGILVIGEVWVEVEDSSVQDVFHEAPNKETSQEGEDNSEDGEAFTAGVQVLIKRRMFRVVEGESIIDEGQADRDPHDGNSIPGVS